MKLKIFFAFMLAVFFTMAAYGDDVPSSGTPKTFSGAGIDIEMVWINGGTFMMGSPETEPGRFPNETQHQVTLTEGFYMSKYLVTFSLYNFVTHYALDLEYPDYLIIIPSENFPATDIIWYNAIAFCNKLSLLHGLTPAYIINGKTDPDRWGDFYDDDWDTVTITSGSTGYRLPTEAQWEYACRAGTTTAFNWNSNVINRRQANYNASIVDANNLTVATHLGRIVEVGTYAPNKWGLYDMHGNIFEWVWDRFDDYPTTAETNPSGAVSGGNRVTRSGAWYLGGEYQRSAHRLYAEPSRLNVAVGFRLVRP